MAANQYPKRLLWWGRFDPGYARNRILRNILTKAGYEITDFIPKISRLGRLESYLRGVHSLEPDAVWIPAFRHRDFASGRSYAKTRKIPLIFDPLISRWDKVVFERRKQAEHDQRSKRLLHWEQAICAKADLLIADTELHASFFIETLKAEPENVHVVPVGAEEPRFSLQSQVAKDGIEVLFYGSFINLQGPEHIVDAAKLVPQVNWVMLGNGPLLDHCKQRAGATPNLTFEDWISYDELPERIGRADILLGIFGTSPKAGRVIPNKVYQSVACGRPVITRYSEAYPPALLTPPHSGIYFIPPGRSEALASAVTNLIEEKSRPAENGKRARQIYESYYAEEHVAKALKNALKTLNL